MPYALSKDGLEIFYDYHNLDSDKQAMFFIHGWLCNWTTFSKEITHFKKEGHPVIYMDIRGHGDSEAPASERYYHLERIAEDVQTVLAEIRYRKKIALVGHSMGGAVSMLYTLKHPSRVKALILIDSLYKAPARVRLRHLTIDLKKIEKSGLFHMFLRFVLKHEKGHFIFDYDDDRDLNKPAKSSEIMFFAERLVNAPITTEMFFLEEMFKLRLGARLRGIKAKTLVIAATRDQFFPKEVEIDLSRKIKGAELIINDGDHANIMLQSKKIAKYIEDFMGWD